MAYWRKCWFLEYAKKGFMMYRKFALLIMLAIPLMYACNKNKLDQPSLGELDESKVANKNGVERLLIGAYAMLDGISIGNRPEEIYGHSTGPSNWIYGSICGSEAYKGSNQGDQAEVSNLEKFIPVATNSFLNTKWVAIYAGIARSNTVLRVMKKAKDIRTQDQKQIEAEARFLRGFYHFEAIKIWNKVPYVDETITYDAGNYHVGNDTLIWGAIQNDLKFAMLNLVAVPSAIGRANSSAAEAFLAKAYLYNHKYAEAKLLLEDLVNNGVTAAGTKYALVKYADNFNAAKKNGAEQVFSAQLSVNDGAETTYPDGFVDGGFNGNLGDEWNFPQGAGSVTICCGFFQPSQYLVNHFKTNISGLPDLDNYNLADVKNDQNIPSTLPFDPYAGTLDPRLDWTVGRRGIPYLDWGIDPGEAWIRDQTYGGPYQPKKNVFYKTQAGIYSQNGWSPGATANNVNLIRFADILLWAAEVEIEIGDLDKAQEYINRIRNRAADPANWVYTYTDPNDPLKGYTNTPAANYFVRPYPTGDFIARGRDFARKALRFERMLEFGMEGHRFFDLVRWGTADTEINAYLQKEKNVRSHLNDAHFTKNKNEYFPIPQSQIDLSAGTDGVRKMKQNAGY